MKKTKEQINNMAYELMVKQNPDEAIKVLILYDKLITEIADYIDKASIPIQMKTDICNIIHRTYRG